MEANVYTPPAVELVRQEERHPFYVVSLRKFVALYVMTFGFYKYYWFYRHWQGQTRWGGARVWPLLPAVFFPFSAYRLFVGIARHAAARGPVLRWHPVVLASLYVLLVVAQLLLLLGLGAKVGLEIPGRPYMLIDAVLCVALCFVQHSANLACGQAKGESNCHLDWGNYPWILLGVWPWTAFILSLYNGLSGAAD